MTRQTIGRFVSIIFVFVGGMAPAMAGVEGTDRSPYDLTVARAVRLLPKRPMQVAVIDADQARPEVRDTLMRLDAFTIAGSKVVYLVEQSAVLQAAANGSQLYEHILASIIWHEMAHGDGAGERAAQRAEEQLWTQFVRDGIFDQVTALRYLQALRSRRTTGCLLATQSPRFPGLECTFTMGSLATRRDARSKERPSGLRHRRVSRYSLIGAVCLDCVLRHVRLCVPAEVGSRIVSELCHMPPKPPSNTVAYGDTWMRVDVAESRRASRRSG